jgi:hypothetical protein
MRTRTSNGVLREVWVEPNPIDFAGLRNEIVYTDIPRDETPFYKNQPSIDYVEVYMYIDSVIGNPVIPDPVPSWGSNNRLQVQIQQTNPDPGSGAAYTLDIRLNSSIVR